MLTSTTKNKGHSTLFEFHTISNNFPSWLGVGFGNQDTRQFELSHVQSRMEPTIDKGMNRVIIQMGAMT